MAANGTTGAQPAWKRELNDKIAAARAKRQAGQQGTSGVKSVAKGEILAPGEADSRAARVAAAVAARYAQAPSYSEYMASEVRAAVMAAAQAQQSAARAVVEAEQARAMVAQLTAPAPDSPLPPTAERPPQSAPPANPTVSQAPVARVDYAASGIPSRPGNATTPSNHARNDSRQIQPTTRVTDPLAEALITPATPLPANLLEFPRELVAARKARPRHAEGPLRDESGDQTQLRIFEVEPEAISTVVEAVPAATEWSSIRLDAYPAPYTPAHPTDGATQSAPDTVSSRYSQDHPVSSGVSTRHASQGPNHDSRYAQDRELALVRVASLEDRLMATLVDTALVGIAFLLFAFVFTASTVHPPTGKPALIGSAIVLAGFYLLYQFLFFSFSSGTPGMLYARIALCTFDDDNPTREAMRKRIFAVVLAAMPLGLGFLYAIFDEDHLGWHDRMTRMYQRSYK
jgi:uncharacterized RDD family membrane protein YckC